MSVRERKWTTQTGEVKTAWVVNYTDAEGKRRLETFDRKKDAEARHDNVRIDVRRGTHKPDSQSIDVREAGERWIKTCELGDEALERTTVETYRQHLAHINKHLGRMKLSRLSVPEVVKFRKKLLAEGTSGAMVRKLIVSLGALIAAAQEEGEAAHNPVRELPKKKKRRKRVQTDKGKHEVGVDIPSPVEIKALLTAAKARWDAEGPERWRPLLLVAIYTGLRASELRGLRWSDIDFKKGELHVRQRADRHNAVGKPKSEAGERTVPIPPGTLGVLREWRLRCEGDLVFPNGVGRIESHSNIINRGLIPTVIAAGLASVKKEGGKVVLDEKGKPVMVPKYKGLHALRHYFASWCLNRKKDGGCELPAKVVQERLGHATIALTMDLYGHLFPRGDDTAELAEAEQQTFA